MAARIRRARERQSLTQEELAVRSGISVSFASLLERGERSPSYETLLQVAFALGVAPTELLGEADAASAFEPHVAQLNDFVAQNRLGPAEVEKMISVARVMFYLGGDKPRGASEGKDFCAHAGCCKDVLARGLCSAHYHRARRAR